jgi:3-deoxy-manno-octulosonate cytidylyltransferase (CMP-KDO synthetase)
MKFVGIIPARYASTRFPGKPLINIGGKSMIQRVYERASEAIRQVVVATDDERIFDAVKEFDGEVVMTAGHHQSGTDRCAEAYHAFIRSSNADVVINIQGDEPFIKKDQFHMLMKCFTDPEVSIATLIRKVDSTDDLFDENKTKVVIDEKEDAIYFSRMAIPFLRGIPQDKWVAKHTFYSHLGIYAYKTDTLLKLSRLSQGILEKAESLEQLRWIENGLKIRTSITPFDNFGIDTPEDVQKAKELGYFE